MDMLDGKRGKKNYLITATLSSRWTSHSYLQSKSLDKPKDAKNAKRREATATYKVSRWVIDFLKVNIEVCSPLV